MLTVCILLNRLKFRHDVLKMTRKILQRNCLNVFETGEVKEANSNLIFSSTFEGVPFVIYSKRTRGLYTDEIIKRKGLSIKPQGTILFVG